MAGLGTKHDFELENNLFTRISYATAITVMALATLLGVVIATAMLMDTAGFISISNHNATTWSKHFPFIGGLTVMEGIARIILCLAIPTMGLSLYFCFYHVDASGEEIEPGTGVRWGLPVVAALGLAMAFLWMVRPPVEPVPLVDHKPAVPEPAPNFTGSLKLFKPCDKGMCSDVQ